MFDEMENYDWHYFESQLNTYEELFVEAYIYDEFFHRLISDVYLRKTVPTNKSLSLSRKFYILENAHHLWTAKSMKFFDLFLTFHLTIIV